MPEHRIPIRVVKLFECPKRHKKRFISEILKQERKRKDPRKLLVPRVEHGKKKRKPFIEEFYWFKSEEEYPPEVYTWRAKSYNKDKAMREFVKEFLFPYFIPFPIIISTQLEGLQGEQARDLFKQVVNNEKIDDLTKKERHFFLSSKSRYTGTFAIRRLYMEAYCKAAGRPDLIGPFDYFMKYGICNPTDLRPFLKFLARRNGILSEDGISQSVEFLRDRHFEFDFAGRTPHSFWKLVEQWHVEVRKQKYQAQTWSQRFSEKTWNYQSGSVLYYVEELTTSKELSDEGRKMHHCVASYIPVCVSGACHIFSIRKETNGNLEPISTFELKGNNIIQHRGKCNVVPSNDAINVLNKWKNHFLG